MNPETKLRELIAIGASVTANCQPCLEYHVAQALAAGADRAEIGEAISVGKSVRRGAAAKMDALAARVTLDQPAPEEVAADRDCGCQSAPER